MSVCGWVISGSTPLPPALYCPADTKSYLRPSTTTTLSFFMSNQICRLAANKSTDPVLIPVDSLQSVRCHRVLEGQDSLVWWYSQTACSCPVVCWCSPRREGPAGSSCACCWNIAPARTWVIIVLSRSHLRLSLSYCFNTKSLMAAVSGSEKASGPWYVSKHLSKEAPPSRKYFVMKTLQLFNIPFQWWP